MKNSKHARKIIAKLAGLGHLPQPPGITPFLPSWPGKGNYIGLSLGGGNEEAEQSKPPWRAQLLLGMCLAWKPGRLHLLLLFDVHPRVCPGDSPKGFLVLRQLMKGRLYLSLNLQLILLFPETQSK